MYTMKLVVMKKLKKSGNGRLNKILVFLGACLILAGLVFLGIKARISRAQQSTGIPVVTIPRKVMVLVFNPYISGSTGVVEYFHWYDPYAITDQLISQLNTNSHGKVFYTIPGGDLVTSRTFPKKCNGIGQNNCKASGYIYDATTYQTCIANESTCYRPDIANYLKILNDFNVCGKLNSGEIDELWMWGGPWFGFYESNLAGPNGFWYNSSPTTGTSCNKLLPIMGFSYKEPFFNVLHDFGHRTEATMTKIYGTWEENRTLHDWDKYGLTIAQSPKYTFAGCGSIHYAPNASTQNNFSASNVVNSICEALFNNYPNYGDVNLIQAGVSCNNWGCDNGGDENYFNWWLAHLPYYAGTTTGQIPWTGFPIPTTTPDAVSQWIQPDGTLKTNFYKGNRYWGYVCTYKPGTEIVTGCTPSTTQYLSQSFGSISDPGGKWSTYHIPTSNLDAVSAWLMPDGVLRTNVYQGGRYWGYNCSYQAGTGTIIGCAATATNTLAAAFGGITDPNKYWSTYKLTDHATNIDGASAWMTSSTNLRTNIYDGDRYWGYNCTYNAGTEVITGCVAAITSSLSSAFSDTSITNQGTQWKGYPIFKDYVDSATAWKQPNGVLRTNIFRGNRLWAYNCSSGCTAISTSALIQAFSGIGLDKTLNDWWAYMVNPNVVVGPWPQAKTVLMINNQYGSLTIPRNTNFSLNWNSEFASYCTASNAWSDVQNPSGYVTLSKATAGVYTYTLSCGNSPAVSVAVTVQ